MKTKPTSPVASNQISKVRIVSRRTWRRSCSIICHVSWRVSGVPPGFAASKFKSARPRSVSLMFVYPFQNLAQRPLGVMQARTHGADRATDDLRHIFVSHFFEKPEYEDLALLLR